ncbi:MAG: N-6 DNA methylase, partial [Bacteroidetes bacterium]|nr:N-6 DNA methylase [Bacteroidota bacterium]
LSNGVDPVNDLYGRFQDYGVPPTKNGDYAFLLHILRSLKSKGKGAVILPHGVLFRGNAEGEIRKNLIGKGKCYIKGIVGLPANLFFGTGIHACIIMLDKENAVNRKGIFMIDASKGFIKDGNKNRLQAQDIHRIVDVFNKQLEEPKYSRMVPLVEIEKNEFNLNIPRYVNSQEPEDLQDIEAHLLGGIPNTDIETLSDYWKIYPSIRNTLFEPNDRENYTNLKVNKDEIQAVIFNTPEFVKFGTEMQLVFDSWKTETIKYLKGLDKDCRPKEIILKLSETLLKQYEGKALINNYDIYQHLMDYWENVMQDDLYIISSEGWEVGGKVNRKTKITKSKGKKKETEIKGLEGIESELMGSSLIIDRYFVDEMETLIKLETDLEGIASQMEELAEEHSDEEGCFGELDKVNKTNVTKLLKSIQWKQEFEEDLQIINEYLTLAEKEVDLKKKIKASLADMEKKVWSKYAELSIDEIKTLVVDNKWIHTVEDTIQAEMDSISQRLTQRIKELGNRYEKPLPKIITELSELERKVNSHLEKMGFIMNL